MHIYLTLPVFDVRDIAHPMRIVIADDELLFCDLVRKACVQELGCEVVGEAHQGEDAISIITACDPELVVLDLVLPSSDGFEVMHRTRCAGVHSRFLVVSAHCEDYTAFRVAEANVAGFIDKHTTILRSMKIAFSEIRQGRRYFSETFMAARLRTMADPHSFLKTLSDRELKVLGMLGQGLDDVEIGRCLGISVRTAQTHRAHISAKLRIPSVRKLARFSQEHGVAMFASAANKSEKC